MITNLFFWFFSFLLLLWIMLWPLSFLIFQPLLSRYSFALLHHCNATWIYTNFLTLSLSLSLMLQDLYDFSWLSDTLLYMLRTFLAYCFFYIIFSNPLLSILKWHQWYAQNVPISSDLFLWCWNEVSDTLRTYVFLPIFFSDVEMKSVTRSERTYFFWSFSLMLKWSQWYAQNVRISSDLFLWCWNDVSDTFRTYNVL